MNEEYNVSDYGIFSDAVSTTNSLNDTLESNQDVIGQCKNQISDASIFMGPICDSCVDAFGNIDTKVTTLISNFSKIGAYLTETAGTYQRGDSEAATNILKIDSNGSVVTGFASAGLTGATAQDQITNYLSSQGFNNAAICAILANVEHESGFDPHATGDGGTSYGICQWHNSRWENLNNYCASNNLDSTTLEGQLEYLVYELKTSYPGVYNTLQSVPDTAQGAYDASYAWTVDFEVPADKYNQAANRGNTAQNYYNSTYSV